MTFAYRARWAKDESMPNTYLKNHFVQKLLSRYAPTHTPTHTADQLHYMAIKVVVIKTLDKK